MSNPVRRLLFDECIGKPVMINLRGFVPQDVELCHITDKYITGAKDEDWIPKLGEEGGWVVITSDAGRHSKVGQKLPQLCLANKVTHVVLSGTLNQATSLEKVSLIAAGWPMIDDVFLLPRGSRYLMRRGTKDGKRSLTVSVELCQVTAALLSGDAPAANG